MQMHSDVYRSSDSTDSIKINEVITCLISTSVRDGRTFIRRNKTLTSEVGLGMEVVWTEVYRFFF